MNNKTTYNRNRWRTNTSFSITGEKLKVISGPIEKNDKIVIRLSNKGSINNEFGVVHEIIGIEGNLMLVFREKNNTILLY
jgi:hypothetical protein